MNYPEQIPAAYAADSSLDRAYRLGWNHGHGIACHNVPSIGDSIDCSVDWIGLGKVVTADNIAEYHELLCYAAESNSRDYSPFEFTAHEFRIPLASFRIRDCRFDPQRLEILFLRRTGLIPDILSMSNRGQQSAITPNPNQIPCYPNPKKSKSLPPPPIVSAPAPIVAIGSASKSHSSNPIFAQTLRREF
jgi:hypothetical protein